MEEGNTMKKNAIAAALLACIGTMAQAEDNTTIFGLIDLNITNTKGGAPVGSPTLTQMNDGTVNGLNGSRWGIRSYEDLGGGLRAGVHLESGFFADTGSSAQGGRLFGRQGFVYLSQPSAGELRLGRQYVLEDSVMCATTPFTPNCNSLTLNPGTAITNRGVGLPFWLNAPRADNVVMYQTPSFGGAYAAVQWAPGENTFDTFHGLKLGYTGGPLTVAASYEWSNPRTGIVIPANLNIDPKGPINKSITFGSNYDFGPARLYLGYQSNDNLVANPGANQNGALLGFANLTVSDGTTTFPMKKSSGPTVGVGVPIGSWLLGVNYTRMKFEGPSTVPATLGQTEHLTLGKAGIGAVYSLSKVTFLYASISEATGDLKDQINQKTVSQVGLRKAF